LLSRLRSDFKNWSCGSEFKFVSAERGLATRGSFDQHAYRAIRV
jgi:hypothetical protein